MVEKPRRVRRPPECSGLHLSGEIRRASYWSAIAGGGERSRGRERLRVEVWGWIRRAGKEGEREREVRNVFFFYCFLCNLTKSKRARGTEGEERGELLQSECVTPAGPWEDPVNTAQSQL